MIVSRARLRVCVAFGVIAIFGIVQYIPNVDNRNLLPRLIIGPDDIEGSFSYIYKDHLWGDDEEEEGTPFFSGLGSHDAEVVDPYLAATRSFISSTFDKAPNVVDLGCGDFNVGQHIRNLTDRYIACDVVADMIEYNRHFYKHQDVDFRVLNIVSDDLPAGDVVLVRQVFQHLKNAQVSNVLPKLDHYRWAIITEHIPLKDPFVPNIDMYQTGSVRLANDSGIELTLPPFNFPHHSATVLSESVVKDGRIRTTAYQLQQ